MIFRPNGQPYITLGSRQQFDDGLAERDLFNRWDQEAIRIGGSPIFYYEMFIQEQTLDKVYLEDRGKIFSNNPVQLYGYYDPIAAQNFMGVHGMDSPDEMVFEFNYRAVLDAIGHPPKRGSRLKSPFLKEDWFVIEGKLAEFKYWQVLHIQLHCTRFQEDIGTGEGQVTQDKVDYKII